MDVVRESLCTNSILKSRNRRAEVSQVKAQKIVKDSITKGPAFSAMVGGPFLWGTQRA